MSFLQSWYDVYLSGGHKIIFYNGNNDLVYRVPCVYIPNLDKHEIKSESEVKSITNEEECRYYHIQLEDTNEGVITGGIVVETLGEDEWEKGFFVENV
jgi:hypothetical protein